MFNWFKNSSKIKEKRNYSERTGLWNSYPNTLSGVTVNSTTATQHSAVLAATRLLAESVAKLPLIIYKKLPNGGKVRAEEHPLNRVFKIRPNIYQDSFIFREQLMFNLLLRGNAYFFIIGDSKIKELRPIHPSRVKPYLNQNSNIIFEFTDNKNNITKYTNREILHIKGIPSHEDPVRGLSVIEACPEAVAVGLAAQNFAATFFQNAGTPYGVLQYPGVLTDELYNRLKKEWKDSYSGKNSNSTAILEEGMTYQPITGINLSDSQFLESRKFQVSDIARIFRVPPHLIGDLDKATFSNIEQQSLDFLIHTLTGWTTRIELALKSQLLTESEQQEYEIEFLLDSLLRADTPTRFSAYATARTHGWLSVDEIREKENLNPLPNNLGKIYLEPLNMKEVGKDTINTTSNDNLEQ